MRTPQQHSEPGLRWRCRPRRAAVLAGAILTVGIAAAGCGGGSSTPGVATGSSTTAAASPPAGAGMQATGLLAYASCMRSHGVPNFPDPTGSGGIPKQAIIRATQALSASQAEAAERGCKHALPAGGSLSGRASQTVTAQEEQYYLRAAACMRSHGISNFPDPSFLGGEVEFPMLSRIVDPHSTRFIQAEQTCQKLIPGGLPYSGGAGS
jgi:hypothetical protein